MGSVKRPFFNRYGPLDDLSLLRFLHLGRATYRPPKQVQNLGDFERIASPYGFDSSQQRPRHVLGFNSPPSVEEVSDHLKSVGKPTYRGGTLDDGCLRADDRRVGIDERRKSDEQAHRDTDKSSAKPRAASYTQMLASH
jgi:hypothetical protein